MLTSPSIVTEEREELEKLKHNFEKFLVDVDGLKDNPEVSMSPASSRLSMRVRSMIEKIEGEVKKVVFCQRCFNELALASKKTFLLISRLKRKELL